MMRRAALIGYTNAGKSSLMNAMIEMGEGQGKHVYEEDMLFATLDTSVRMIPWASRKFLLYDTVGFVSDLPHTLVDAFQATLDAARDADLLIHVIDGSDPQWQRKADISEDTLKQIGAGDIPLMRVFTKSDLMEEIPDDGMIHVSSLTRAGMDQMMDTVLERLYPDESRIRCLVPYDKMSAVSDYRSVLLMKTIEETEEGVVYEISGPSRYTDAFRSMRI
jgi:GTP-binding protein HflX